jgi:beta-glucosidase
MAASSVKKIQLEKEVEVSESDLAALAAADAYSPDVTLYNDFFINTFYEKHHRGTFTTADNLGDMAKESFAVRMILRFIIRAMLSTMKGKSKDDPSVKIAISAIEENPLESLISITNGVLSEKRMQGILRLANGKHK